MGDESRALAGEIFAVAVLQFGEHIPDITAGNVAGRLFDLVLSATEKAAVRSALRTACRFDCGTSWYARRETHCFSLCLAGVPRRL